MKLLVPVYDLTLVPAVVAAAADGGHIAAIVNPDSGPGGGSKAVPSWKSAIAELRYAGAQVLYYVGLVNWDENTEKEKATTAILAEMDKYFKFYGTSVGWFFDDLRPFSTSRAKRLAKIVTYKGGFTIANPGISDDATKGYLDTGVTALVTWETKGYALSTPPDWEKYLGARIGGMAVKEPDFKTPLAVARKRNVNLFYATDASDDDGVGGGNIATWSELPPYFKEMAEAVSDIDSDLLA